MTPLTLLGDPSTEAHEVLPHLPVSVEDMEADGVAVLMHAPLEEIAWAEIEEEEDY